jgi:flagellar basal body-associated protein FliL
METLKNPFVILVIGGLIFLIPYLIYYFINLKKGTKKTTGKKSSNKTTSTPPNPQSPSKKSRDWWKTLRSIIWTLLALFLVIWIGILIARGYKKLREPSSKSQTEKISEPLYKDDYFLKEGEPIIILIKDNYYYKWEGYGKKYYSQSFRLSWVGPKNLIGGGLPYIDDGEGLTKKIFSFYEEEGRLTIYYSKDKKKLEGL